MRAPLRSDSAVLLTGRNSQQVHPFLFGNHTITMDEHRKWLENRLADKDKPIFLLLQDNKPLGLVNLTHLDKEHKRGEWAFWIWAPDAPKGAGTAMLAAFLDELFLHRGLRKLCALVLVSNKRSLHLHKKLGFVEEGMLKKHVLKKGEPQDAIAFAIFDDVWKDHRKKFASAIASVELA